MANLNSDRTLEFESLTIQRRSNRAKFNQYFTPESVIEKALSFLPEMEPKTIIDPAAGDGAFLTVAAKLWKRANFFAVDIDHYLIPKLRGTNSLRTQVYCANSLERKTWENPELDKVLSKGGFDLVLGNPPFSSWFDRIKDPRILNEFRLAHQNGKLMRGQAIEVLFLEKFIRLARENGFIIIILPDGILSNPQYQYVREFTLQETKIIRIISLPRNVFENTSAKTTILILRKQRTKALNYLVPISHLDKNGQANGMIKVDAENLRNRMDYHYHHYLEKSSFKILSSKGIRFKPLSDFIVYCKTGKTLYGKDRKFSKSGIKFLHATNITDLGIDYARDEKFIDPKSKMYSPEAHARLGDLVFVRVGVGCAGRIAIVDSREKEGVVTDYLHIFRVKGTNPYFLVAYLKTRFGKDSINLLKHGVGTISINKTDLLSLPIPIVPVHIQQAISAEFKRILADSDSEEQIRAREMKNLIDHLENQLLNCGKEIQDVQATAN